MFVKQNPPVDSRKRFVKPKKFNNYPVYKKTVDEKTNTNKPSLAVSNSSLDAFLKKDPVIGTSFKKPFVNRKSFLETMIQKEEIFQKTRSFKTVSRTRTDDFKNEIKPILVNKDKESLLKLFL